MKILLCAPFELDAPRGNSVAARRLFEEFTDGGHRVHVLDRCESADPAEAVAVWADFEPDVALYLHAGRCARQFMALRPLSPAPMVVSMRGTDVNEMLGRSAAGALIRGVLEQCDAITVFSPAMRESLHRRLPALAPRVHVIPNGLELPGARVDFRLRLGLDSQPVFVTLAGVRRVKRLPWLVRGLARLRADHPGLVLLQAGPVIEPEEGCALAGLAAAHPWLRTLGVLPREEAIALLLAGDVFVSGSRSEGMPHSVREAMSLGLPPLLSDNAGHRAMAEDEREALFFRDRTSLRVQAGRLLADPELRRRLGEAARRRVANDLARGREQDLYLALFRQLLGLVYP